MEPPLPLKSVVLFAAVGALTFIIIFIFVKRQITRFALKSSHVPHFPIGSDSPKTLKQEIERRLRRTADIQYEPQLLHTAPDQPPPLYFDGKVYHAYYRMKAIDSIKRLESLLQEYDSNVSRRPGSCLRIFLTNQMTGALRGVSLATIERLCALHDHARHSTAEFREEQYAEFEAIMMQLLQLIRNKINKGENKKTFPLQVGDSIFYCSQSMNEPAPELKDSSVRFRTGKSSTAGFIKLKNRDSFSSQTSDVDAAACREQEQAV